jgi:hypothetical protein
LFRESYLRAEANRRANELDTDELARAEKELRAVYSRLHGRDASLLGEDDTRSELVDPVLELLGFKGVRGKPLKWGGKPDYLLALPEDAEALDKTVKAKLWPEVSLRTLCVAEAKPASAPLDRWRTEDGKRILPLQQLDDYLQASGVRWGILTNGINWRLVSSHTAYRLNSYVEFDLGKWWKQGNDETFRLFYVLFCANAFLKDPSGKCWLDQLYDENLKYGRDVEDDLCDRAFTALEIAANGFLELQENGLDKKQLSSDLLHDLWSNSVILLYRTLFVLNAEDRGILPVDHTAYESSSLGLLRREMCEGKQQYYSEPTQLWSRLVNLFHWIDQGQKFKREGFSIEPYNGKLFSPEEYPFLEKYKLSDRAVADLVKVLGTTEERNGNEVKLCPIRFAELQLKHLGKIYEGLLEHKLFHADRDMAIDISEEGWKYKPRADLSDDEVQKLQRRAKKAKRKSFLVEKGSLYVATDKTERRLSGTYYTPDFVVNYIVAHTVTALCGGLAKRTDSVDAILGLRVLDPATGSGHFLVRAAESIAEALATDPHADDWLIRQGREDIQSLPAKDQMTFWLRTVVERCIYGVDINPLAVELAKLSLWLLTLAKDKPLSFLDHHIRCGDSLVGTALFDEAMGQAVVDKHVKEEVFKGVFAEYHKQVLGKPSDKIDDVKFKTQYLRDWDRMRDDLRAIADLQLLADAFPDEKASQNLKAKDLAALAEAVVDFTLERQKRDEKKAKFLTKYGGLRTEKLEERPTFHWEVEFPEVFLEPSGNGDAVKRRADAGFDAVISNPPYVRQEKLKNSKKFLESYEVGGGSGDLYTYFFERAHKLLRPGGLFGFICSNKFIRARYGKALLKFLATNATVLEFIDFGELPVFPNIGAFPAIFIHERGRTDKQARWCNMKSLEGMVDDWRTIESVVKETGSDVPQANFTENGWMDPRTDVGLLDKIKHGTVPLKDYVGGRIYRGVLTGRNEAFIIDADTRERLINEDPRSAEIINPVLMGDDVRKWHANWKGTYLIVTRIGVGRSKAESMNERDAENEFKKSLPAIHRHLLKFKDKLTARQDQGEFWWELRACDYYEVFEKPKIVFPDIAKESRFFFDESGFYLTNTGYVVGSPDASLAAILNSRMVWYWMRQVAAVLGDADKRGRLRSFSEYTERIPIKRVPDTLSASDAALLARVKEVYDGDPTKGAADKVAAAVGIGSHLEGSALVAKLLAFLAERIQEMFAARQEQSDRFFERLRVELDIAAAPPVKRGQPVQWWEWEFDRLAAYLKKSKPDALFGKSENLRRAYDETVPGFMEMCAKIDATDRLIDRLVYALYGLTDEEIAIVEGRAGAHKDAK